MIEQPYCYGCMEPLAVNQKCNHCDYKVNLETASLLHLPPGTILQERYVLGRSLGQGGFGITYLARDTILDLKLAIKEYLPQQLATRSGGSHMVTVYEKQMEDAYKYGLIKFLEEARLLARLIEHPNVVKVRDYFEDNQTAYLVMNYIGGVTLQRYLLSQGGKISTETAINIFIPLLEALKDVHSAGILHRDISPDNLLINTKGRIILIDFGASRQAVDEKSKSLSVILKAGYSPEEQYRAKGLQGPWTDIYALGATFYRSITGQPPPDSLDRMAGSELKPPSALGINITPQQEFALLKAMAVKAKDRFQTVEGFREELIKSEHAITSKGEYLEKTTSDQSSCQFTAPAKQMERPKGSQEGETILSMPLNRVAVKRIALGGAALLAVLLLFFLPLLLSPGEGLNEGRGNSGGNLVNGGLAAVQNDWIYYLNSIEDDSIYRVQLDNGERMRLNQDASWNINVLGDWVYYRNEDDNNAIYKVRIDGTDRTKINNDDSRFINLEGSWLYYSNFDAGGTIYKIHVDGTERSRVNQDDSRFLNLADGWIYYSNYDDRGTIYRIRHDGSDRTRINNDDSDFINLVDDWIYYGNRDDSYSLYRIKTDGTERTRVMDGSTDFINVSGEWVYYSNIDDNKYIYRIKTDGSERTRVNTVPSEWINLAGDWIYFQNHDENLDYYRIRTDGTRLEPAH